MSQPCVIDAGQPVTGSHFKSGQQVLVRVPVGIDAGALAEWVKQVLVPRIDAHGADVSIRMVPV